MGLIDRLWRAIRGSDSSAMRDRHADREAGRDPKLGTPTPSGSMGPSGAVMEKQQGEGGAIEPDPPDTR